MSKTLINFYCFIYNNQIETFFWIFIIELVALREKHSQRFKRWSFHWFDYHIGLWSSVITFILKSYIHHKKQFHFCISTKFDYRKYNIEIRIMYNCLLTV